MTPSGPGTAAPALVRAEEAFEAEIKVTWGADRDWSVTLSDGAMRRALAAALDVEEMAREASRHLAFGYSRGAETYLCACGGDLGYAAADSHRNHAGHIAVALRASILGEAHPTVLHLWEIPVAGAQAPTEAPREPSAPMPPTCGSCGRERGLQDPYDYNPIQALTGFPLGWYSGDDGEICPQCMTELMKLGRSAPQREDLTEENRRG